MRRLSAINALLLLAVAAAIAGVQLRDRSGPRIDAAVREYAAAVAAGDLDGAMAEVAPAQRAHWTPWVQEQLLNRYDVRAISVRAPSLLDQTTRHADARPFEATVAMAVNRDDPESFYQATARVPLVEEGNRWYLAAPLLAPSDGD